MNISTTINSRRGHRLSVWTIVFLLLCMTVLAISPLPCHAERLLDKARDAGDDAAGGMRDAADKVHDAADGIGKDAHRALTPENGRADDSDGIIGNDEAATSPMAGDQNASDSETKSESDSLASPTDSAAPEEGKSMKKATAWIIAIAVVVIAIVLIVILVPRKSDKKRKS